MRRVDLRRRIGAASPAVLAVVAITLLALLVRLVGLGARVMHWDEGRVAYWILRYHETGQFYYRPIIHGPFLPVVNDWVFAVLPPTDFSARLIVALVGGLLPLSALLLRDRLRDVEVVAVAAFLAANPLLVYYSRFMRNDVIVAAFSFLAVALVVRGIDRRRVGYLYPAAASFALGWTAKENGLLYLLCFLGAGTLLLEHRYFRRARTGIRPREAVRDDLVAVKRGLTAWRGDLKTGALAAVGHAAGAVAVFLLVIVFFYAPRPELWTAPGEPALLPGVVGEATVGTWEKFYGTWASGHHQGNDYAPYFFHLLTALAYGAAVLVVFAIVGFVADGYGTTGPRPLVAFATYWGIASLLGYPMATDIRAPWAAVHVVVALAIPAGVGAGYVVRVARRSVELEDAAGTAVAALLLSAAAVGVVGANATYVNSADPDHEQVIQWAQPHNDLKDTLAEARLAARSDDEGPGVLYFGTCSPPGGCSAEDLGSARFYVEDEESVERMPPEGPAWHSRLPLPWYFEAYDVEQTSSHPAADPAETLADPPPVVVAFEWNASDVEPHLDGYERNEHEFRLWSQRIVIYVDRDAADAARTDRTAAGAASPSPARGATAFPSLARGAAASRRFA